MRDPFQAYQLELEVLGPVHVGTGEMFPAYAYQLDIKNHRARTLNLDRLLAILSPSQLENYLQAVSRGPMQAHKTLKELGNNGLVDFSPAVERDIKTSKSFEETVANAVDEAALEFRPLPVNPLGPYIPGSSLKGALRTAWIYHQTEGYEWRLDSHNHWSVSKGEGTVRLPGSAFDPRGPFPRVKANINTDFEAKVLGYMGNKGPDLHRDPFRSLKVADSAPLTKTLLNRLRVFHRRAGADMDLVLLAETVQRNEKIRFDLRFQPGLVKNSLEPESLAEACSAFYQFVYQTEAQFAHEHGMVNANSVYLEIAKRLDDPAYDDGFPLRFGFGSGGLATTLALIIDGTKIPATRKGAGGTDAQMSYPLGWVWGQLKPL